MTLQRQQVYCMPALELLEALPSQSVGAVILDPPSRLGVGGADDETPIDEAISTLHLIADRTAAILKPGGVTIVTGDAHILSAWEVVASWAGLQLVSELVVLWMREWMGSMTRAVRVHTKPGLNRPLATLSLQSNVVVCYPVDREDRVIASQLPVELFNYLISSLTHPLDLVIDPMCGSGASLISASLCERRWIGGDVDETLCRSFPGRYRGSDMEELNPISWWVNGTRIVIGGG